MKTDKKIIPWKNTGKKNSKKRLFRISWSEESKWIKDPKGKHWGFYE